MIINLFCCLGKRFLCVTIRKISIKKATSTLTMCLFNYVNTYTVKVVDVRCTLLIISYLSLSHSRCSTYLLIIPQFSHSQKLVAFYIILIICCRSNVTFSYTHDIYNNIGDGKCAKQWQMSTSIFEAQLATEQVSSDKIITTTYTTIGNYDWDANCQLHIVAIAVVSQTRNSFSCA